MSSFSTWTGNIEGVGHTFIAAFIGGVLGAVEQAIETGKPIPDSPAGWHHFFGTVLAAGLSAALLLWKSPPATAGTAVATVEAAIPAAQQIKSIEPVADSIMAAAPVPGIPKPPGS